MPLKFSRPHPEALYALQEGLKILNEEDSKGVYSVLHEAATANSGVLNAGLWSAGISHEEADNTYTQVHKGQSHHKVYLISMQDIISNSGFDKARLTGWRYITQGKAFDVHCNENCENHVLGHVNEGPHIQGLLEALKSVENHHRVYSDTFEVSIITIPEVYMVALWLQHKDGNDDLFIPIEPTFLPEVKSGKKIFTEAEFVQALKKEESSMLTFDDAPDLELTE